MMLGKFMPPHLGHVYLGHFARNFVDELTILVCSLPREPIPGILREAWMRELFPSARIVPITDDLPQEPTEHPEFWRIWREAIRAVLPGGPDFVFASEDYGLRLARELGATFIPVDRGRRQVPVSGTDVRESPMQYWEYLPSCVRPYFVRRVCVFGPESTGKSTLARQLAERFDTVHVAEFARELLNDNGGRCEPEHIPLIARGQLASEDALARQANRALICDTDLIMTTLWSEALFGNCPAWVGREAERRTYDLYLLLDVDVPWVDDSQRFLPHLRQEFFERCRSALDSRQRPYVVVSGTWPERLDTAFREVDKLLTRNKEEGHA